MIVFIDDILIYSHRREEHEQYFSIVLEILRKQKVYAKFLKCEFWINLVAFSGHIVPNEGIKVYQKKIKSVQSWPRPAIPIYI